MKTLYKKEGVILAAIAPFLLFPTVFILGTAVSLILLGGLWLLLWKSSRRPWPAGPFNGPLLVWSIGMLIGVLASTEPDLTLPKTTGLLLGLGAFRYLAAGDGDGRRFRWGLGALLAAGLVMALIGTVSADWQFEVSAVESLVGRLPPHLVTLPEGPGVGIHMNQLAGAILPYPFILFSLLWGWRPSKHTGLLKGGLVVLIGLLLGLLFLSQSRSGWLGLVVGLAGYILMVVWWHFPTIRRWLVGIGWVFSAVFLVAVVLFTQSPAWEDLWRRPPQETAVGDLSTLDFRREVWFWGITAVEEFPLTGTGLGTFRRVAPNRYPIAVPSDFDIAHAHNIFLQVALDTGLPGLVGYLALLVTAGVVGWQAAGDWIEKRPFILGLLAALIALHAYGMGDTLAPGSKPAIIFWLILGLINSYTQKKE